MSGAFLAVPGAHEAFSAINHTAGDTHIAAASVDLPGHLAAVAAAIGPIGLGAYVPAFGQALVSNNTGAVQVGLVHHAIGLVTTAHKAAVVASDEFA